MNAPVAVPPRTPIEPVTDIYHGVEVIDPYRWLEDGASPRTREWIREQQHYFRAVVDALPHRAQIRREVERMLLVERTSLPVQHGNYWFFTHQGVEDDQPSLYMRRSIDGPDVLLLDPRDRGPDIHVRFRAFSNDGRLVAYYVKRGGDSMKELEIMDVETKETLPDRLPLGYVRGFQFAPDASGFYYAHENPPDLIPTREVRFHRMGTALQEDRVLWAILPDPNVRLGASFHRNCTLAFYGINIANGRTKQRMYIHDLHSGEAPQLLCEMEAHQQQFQLHEDQLIICTSVDSPNKRIEIAPIDCPGHRKTIVPERSSLIQSFILVGTTLFVSYVEDVATRTLIYSLRGEFLGEVPYPSAGCGSVLPNNGNNDGYRFHFESFIQPSSLYLVPAIGRPPELIRSSGTARDLEVMRVWYPSRDGTPIHMYLVAKTKTLCDASAANPAPTFLTAYGASGIPQLPKFSETAVFVAEHGGIFALANIRGGSELGSDWFEAARGRKRQVAIDDFLCASDWLCSHYTSPRRLAIGGGSNSGTLVCAAMTQRPDLFQVVFSFMPLLDMVRFPSAGHANFYVDDLGNPEIKEDFDALLSLSPYHNVVNGTSYPPVYLLGGHLDRRCDPFHVRKMAGRLQSATSSHLPVVLDYIDSWGHNSGRPRAPRLRSLTDRWSFLAYQIGLEVSSENDL